MPRTKIIAIGLAVIGLAMIVIGAMAGILPPPLTGIGFLLIAWDFWARSA
ncbi:MAG: hypothetical protein AAF684_00145 [Pseudomonadota bacterium]